MGRKPTEKPSTTRREEAERHLQFPQESWTEIDAEGTDSEMAQGRESQEPFYTPLVTEAAERKMKEKRAAEARLREDEEGAGEEE